MKSIVPDRSSKCMVDWSEPPSVGTHLASVLGILLMFSLVPGNWRVGGSQTFSQQHQLHQDSSSISEIFPRISDSELRPLIKKLPFINSGNLSKALEKWLVQMLCRACPNHLQESLVALFHKGKGTLWSLCWPDAASFEMPMLPARHETLLSTPCEGEECACWQDWLSHFSQAVC